MNFLKKLGQTVEHLVSNNTKKDALAQEIYQLLKAQTEKPVTLFKLKKEMPKLFDCKIGGAYFVPQNQVPPTDKETGHLLFLLAQINFAQIDPIEDFPTHGLLQIFISGEDDLYGCDFDNQTEQSRWAIRYIEEIPEEISQDNVFVPKQQEETWLPFPDGTEYKMIGYSTTQCVLPYDYQFNDYYAEICNHFSVGDQKKIEKFDDYIQDQLYGIYGKVPAYTCQIGGYPAFTQNDPRDNMSGEIPNYLLFQLDTVEDIMWGDGGVANFFITLDDLQNKEFSNVLYNWDCY